MNYRFQRFTGVYNEFIHQFLGKIGDYKNVSYNELYSKIVQTLYGTANFYSQHMKRLGNSAQDIFADVEPLQKAWAKENSVNYNEVDWLKDIAIKQIKAFKPDVLFLQNLYIFDQKFQQHIRKELDKPIIIIGHRSAPTNDFSVFNNLNLILTAAPHFFRKMKQHGAKAVFMPLAFEKSVIDCLPCNFNREIDFSFVGTVGSPNDAHSQRYLILEKLLEATPIQIWSNVSPKPGNKKKRSLNKFIYELNNLLNKLEIPNEIRGKIPVIRRGARWKFDPTAPSIGEKFPDRIFCPVFGLDNYSVLARSKITFNHHIDCAENYAGNIRLYEATGMGACLITDWKSNLSELFKIDHEIVTYRSADECTEKVNYLLKNDSVRKDIAIAGQKRTLKDHTYKNRLERLNAIIIDELKENRF
jgi:spore maturation protein CgeB